MKKVSLLFFTLFTSALSLFAQPIYNEAGIRLYHTPSQEELNWARSMGYDTLRTAPTPPPEGELRPIAEYEPAEAVLITYVNYWGFGIPFSLIKEMAKDITVITVVSSTSQQNTVLGQYNSNGVNTANCKFLIANTDSYWTRDYGPWFMAIDNNEVAMYDFTYNRPRPNDNQINGKLKTYLSGDGPAIDIYASTIQHAGGNFMNDGVNQAASTDLVLTENPGWTTQQIKQHYIDYMGIDPYHFTNDPLGAYIAHIDCWGKYLAPDKVMIGQVPESHPRYAQYEIAATYFAGLTSPYGTPMKVYRVYTPGGSSSSNITPYTNSLILNNKVFVPISGNTNDAAAIQSYKDAMPGYDVIGIFYDDWENTDALHCRTHEIADRCMLYIKHQPYFADVENTGTLKFNTELFSYCNKTIISDSVLVYLKVNGGNYEGYKMDYSGENKWEVTITDLPDGLVEYYIFAKDESGRRESHPYIARYAPDKDPHKFELKGGTPPPPTPVLVLSKKESSVFSDKLTVVEDIITVYNKGNADLTIDIKNIDFDEMLSISPQVGTIHEGDSLPITFSYNFNNVAKLKEYLGSCTLSSNDPKNKEVTISLKAVLDLVGIKDIDHSKIVIFPNPTTGQLTIKNGQLTIKNVEIFDTIGRKQLSIINCPLSIEVDVSHLPTGIYFIKIADNFYKFVKL